MTKPKDLRDEFALAALPTVLEGLIPHFAKGTEFSDGEGRKLERGEFLAMEVYAVANAMMAEREKTP